jgi:hypothetical protein
MICNTEVLFFFIGTSFVASIGGSTSILLYLIESCSLSLEAAIIVLSLGSRLKLLFLCEAVVKCEALSKVVNTELRLLWY